MHVIDTSQKKAALFFSKHNKNKIYFNMYIEMVDWKPAIKATLDLYTLFGITTKKHKLFSFARVKF